VPGDGGNQLEAKLNRSDTVHYLCEKTTSDYFTLWLNLEQLVPIIIDCWVDNIKLNYDNVTRTTSNRPGVDIRVPGFGTPTVVEWLDPIKFSVGSYFSYIADALTTIGYERGVNIRGAPFDFRKAPNELSDYFKNLQLLIEETYVLNGNTSVILIAHSMGGPLSMYFLQQMSQSWKDKYIHSLITLSAAWAGSVKSVKVFLMGDDLGVFLLQENILKQMQVTMPSVAWLMPSPYFWKPDEVFVQTEKKNYSLSNIKDLFMDIDYPVGWEMYKDQMVYRDFSAPGVVVHCLHGYAVDTVERIVYGPGQFPDGKSTFVVGDGDGTVNRRSLEACRIWNDHQKQKIYYENFVNMDHMDILKDDRSISYILRVINNIE
ncbi:hypothetical protein AAG570_001020, partial [Ranatra chinensis]